MERVPRFPPPHARLVRKEEGPPMYRMLGYADLDNRMDDLCTLYPYISVCGPFGQQAMSYNQTVPVGPGRFRLPMAPLPYTTCYWDDYTFPQHAYVDCRTVNRLYTVPPETRLEAVCFPERAVPGTGVNSKCVISSCLYPDHANPPVPRRTSWTKKRIIGKQYDE